ncbi:Xaa-Pro peptidase family protein [Kaistia defluvii]|uniref:M24 family metallopeptidase n=1 Tax=Kaistia defluvii TaxID=410841 RepID=UPI002251F7CD|nr:Xaa-Pro peptidase family protein [Kaistia defluvii]MCX5518221.1 Xaa-Pro peptidase family protein [Kaistia defluvii]
MSDLDRARAQRLLQERGLDALVLTQPESFTYVTGLPGGVPAMWRRAGGATALVPSDAGARLGAVVGDLNADALARRAPDIDIRTHPLWIDLVDIEGLGPDAPADTASRVTEAYRRDNGGQDVFLPRPTTFSAAGAFAVLGDLLRERGLARARIGIDLEFMPAADFATLQRVLPDIEWVDASEVVRRLRAIKSAREIDCIRRACSLADAGFHALTAGIEPGQTPKDMTRLWRDGVVAAAAACGETGLTGMWDYMSVGSDPWSGGGSVVPGAILKADVGCIVEGYNSDTARSYVFGEPDRTARDVHAALESAFEAGLTAIRPGIAMRDVFEVTVGAMRAAGYSGYRRGHYGHSIGASVGSEEWPFFAADSDVILEPGMALAFETPFYGKGIGALTIEDSLIVTETGIEVLNNLPRELVRLG